MGGEGGTECAAPGGGRGETTDFIYSRLFLLTFLGSESLFLVLLMGETSDIYRLNFICVSVEHLGHSFPEQLALDIACLIACTNVYFCFLFYSFGGNRGDWEQCVK